VRKSSAIMMAIVLLGIGGMLLAANTALRPLAQDAEVAQVLTRWLKSRGDLAPDSRVKARRVRASDKRLATKGKGILLELRPSADVLKREGGLRGLARTVGRAAVREMGTVRLDWIELVLRTGPGEDGASLVTLVPVEEGGEVGEPVPPLPASAPPQGS
jgi:hypothetical protein